MRRLLVVSSVLALLVFGLATVASAGPEERCENRSNNTYRKLLQCVDVGGVREHQAAFQAIADANGGVRVSGFDGYNQSVDYVVERLRAAGYDPEVQAFDFAAWVPFGSTLEQVAPTPTTYASPDDYQLLSQTDPGDVTGFVTPVDLDLGPGNSSTSGCEIDDFVGFPDGHIALVQRGACTFQLKAENAAASGAVGAIIFNQGNTEDRTGTISATLSSGYAGGIPVVFATYDLGVEWSTTPDLEMHLVADVFRGTATTYNVLAETRLGDPDNVVMAGAHLDSVPNGPGIQDNGSGSAAILEVAENMARVPVRNKVRFAWWGAEESGLVGSNHYVADLSPEELEDIALYLNFDMVGSPNHVFFIYDGDDSDGVGAGPGPEGSAQIEALFEEYYEKAAEPFKGTDFSGRSDYQAFINQGIPAGGLFTGAEGIKTDEEAAIWGGTAGAQYDPCYHLACDTFDNISLKALGVNADAIAYAVLTYGYSTQSVNGVGGRAVPGSAFAGG